MGSFRWRLIADPWGIGRQMWLRASWRPAFVSGLDGLEEPPATARPMKGWTGGGFSIAVAIPSLHLHLRRPSQHSLRITSVPTSFALSGQHGAAGPNGCSGRVWAKIVVGPCSGAKMGANFGSRADTQHSQHGWTASCMVGPALIEYFLFLVCFFLKLKLVGTAILLLV